VLGKLQLFNTRSLIWWFPEERLSPKAAQCGSASFPEIVQWQRPSWFPRTSACSARRSIALFRLGFPFIQVEIFPPNVARLIKRQRLPCGADLGAQRKSSVASLLIFEPGDQFPAGHLILAPVKVLIWDFGPPAALGYSFESLCIVLSPFLGKFFARCSGQICESVPGKLVTVTNLPGIGVCRAPASSP
jgi:hypothetical protein